MNCKCFYEVFSINRFNNNDIDSQKTIIIEKYNKASTIIDLIEPNQITEQVNDAIELARTAMECLLNEELEKEYRDKGLIALNDDFSHECSDTDRLTRAINEFLANKILKAKASARIADKLCKFIGVQIKTEPQTDTPPTPPMSPSNESNATYNEAQNDSNLTNTNDIILTAFLKTQDPNDILNNLLKNNSNPTQIEKQVMADAIRNLRKNMEQVANLLDPDTDESPNTTYETNQKTNPTMLTSTPKTKPPNNQTNSLPKIISHQTRNNKLMLTIQLPVDNSSLKPRKIMTLEKALEENRKMVLEYLEEVKGRKSNSYNAITSKYIDILKDYI